LIGQNIGHHYTKQLYIYQDLSVYSDFLDRAQLLTQKLVKQGYVDPKLRSSLQKLYCRHHELVDRYKISIHEMVMMDFFPFYLYFCSFLYHRQNFYWTWLYDLHGACLIRNRNYIKIFQVRRFSGQSTAAGIL